jgi:thioredoxin 1
MSAISEPLQSFIDTHTVTDATFDKEVLSHTSSVLAFFWADWCGPCLSMLPVMQAISEEYPAEDLKVVFIATDKNKVMSINDEKTAERKLGYVVRAIPTFVFFKEGKYLDSSTGSVAKPYLESMIKKLLKLQPLARAKKSMIRNSTNTPQAPR